MSGSRTDSISTEVGSCARASRPAAYEDEPLAPTFPPCSRSPAGMRSSIPWVSSAASPSARPVRAARTWCTRDPRSRRVADDPGGERMLRKAIAAHAAPRADARRRVHLAALPMDDPEENAIVVNALQRHASVVVQKSLAEGFGLTVAEAMWK